MIFGMFNPEIALRFASLLSNSWRQELPDQIVIPALGRLGHHHLSCCARMKASTNAGHGALALQAAGNPQTDTLPNPIQSFVAHRVVQRSKTGLLNFLDALTNTLVRLSESSLKSDNSYVPHTIFIWSCQMFSNPG